MTNNGTGYLENANNVIYDSSHNTQSGQKRVGTSATEIELLDDIPLSFGTGATGSGNNFSDRGRSFDPQAAASSSSTQRLQSIPQNGYQQQSSFNQEQTRPNVVYKSENDQQLNSTVHKLLEKYAPDANPQNLLNTTNSRQINVVTSREEPSFSTFQTNPPPSSTTSNNYSTIIRPQAGQMPQNQTQTNTANNNPQQSTRPQPASNYDSFQHVNPASSQQQQPQTSVPIKTRNGGNIQVIPGQLYSLDDDPLHIFYDRQNLFPNNQSVPQQQEPFVTTFQPSSNFNNNQDPLAAMFGNTSQRYPSQPTTTTTMNPSSNNAQPFDLGNLIKRVQQDYMREIEPYVSSVKFVEKDHEFGQSLNDIGFTAPFTVQKGFSRQADDILRRSSGRQDHIKKAKKDDVDYSDDDDIGQLPPSTRRQPLEKFDSKQSFTSITSTSANESDSDYDDEEYSSTGQKSSTQVHDQGTSPPPKLKQTKIQPQIQKPPAAPAKQTTTDKEKDKGGPSTTVVPNQARHGATNKMSETPTRSSAASSDNETHSDAYNEHDHTPSSRANPLKSTNALVTNTTILEQGTTGSRAPQRSEEIHPVIPTNTRTPVRQVVSDGSDTIGSRSNDASETDDDASPPASAAVTTTTTTQNPSSTPQRAATDNNTTQAAGSAPNSTIHSVPADQRNPTGNRSAVAAAPPPNSRDAVAAAPNSRDAVAAAPPPNSRDAVAAAPNSRDAVAAAPKSRDAVAAAPPPNSRDAVAAAPKSRDAVAAAPNSRDAVAAAPPTTDNRSAAGASATQPTPAGGAAQTGSTRLFKSDGDRKRSVKGVTSHVGDKIRSMFSRKK